jgi:nucleotide-binding universal stress UspA family protein
MKQRNQLLRLHYNNLMLPSPRHNSALEDFKRARRRAAAQEILRRFTGQPVTLLPFDEIYQNIPTQGSRERGLQEIPLKAIVGSMGRYTEFSRDFLPRSSALQGRWTRIKSAFRTPEDMPPIKVYQIGEVYFVLDGNHRVSVARQRGAHTIRAYVTELQTPVAISPNDDLDSIIINAEREKFIQRTQFSEEVVANVLRVSAPGKYRILEQQIESYIAQAEKGITWPQAARRWLEEVYQPIAEVIQAYQLLRDFPGRTVTDLYIWILQHQEALKETLGWGVAPEEAARNLAEQHSPRPNKVVARLGERLLGSLTPAPMESGPKTGEWRRQVTGLKRTRLFERVLVALSGSPESWQALQQAIHLAQREQATVLGLHVVAKEQHKKTPQIRAIEQQFHAYCQEAGLQDEFALAVGNFRANLEATLELLHANDIPVVLGTVASNLRDQEPLEEMMSSQKDSSPTTAAGRTYEQARAFLQDAQPGKARESFITARDLDGVRFRAPSELNTVIHEVATKSGVPVADIARAFDREARWGIQGATCFWSMYIQTPQDMP